MAELLGGSLENSVACFDFSSSYYPISPLDEFLDNTKFPVITVLCITSDNDDIDNLRMLSPFASGSSVLLSKCLGMVVDLGALLGSNCTRIVQDRISSRLSTWFGTLSGQQSRLLSLRKVYYHWFWFSVSCRAVVTGRT
jgi:hypothetical protein